MKLNPTGEKLTKVKNSNVQSFYNTIQYPEPLFSISKLDTVSDINEQEFKREYVTFIGKHKEQFIKRHRITNHTPDHETATLDIADFGCGTGNNAVILASIYPNSTIHCYDIAEESLNHLKRTIKILSITNLHLFNMDIMNDEITEKYDLIFSLGVMHHTQSITKTFTNITSSLKETGIGTFFLYHKHGKFYEILANKLVLLLASNSQEKLDFIEQSGLDRRQLSMKLGSLYEVLLHSSKNISLIGRFKSLLIRVMNKFSRLGTFTAPTSINNNWDGFAHPLAQFIDTHDIAQTINSSQTELDDLWFGDTVIINETSTRKMLKNLGLETYVPNNAHQLVYSEIQETLIFPRKIYFSVQKNTKP